MHGLRCSVRPPRTALPAFSAGYRHLSMAHVAHVYSASACVNSLDIFATTIWRWLCGHQSRDGTFPSRISPLSARRSHTLSSSALVARTRWFAPVPKSTTCHQAPCFGINTIPQRPISIKQNFMKDQESRGGSVTHRPPITWRFGPEKQLLTCFSDIYAPIPKTPLEEIQSARGTPTLPLGR